jgi:hypothetical protein
MTTFYCLRFETLLTWRARSQYLYYPETRWPGYTPRHRASFLSPPTNRRATVEVFDLPRGNGPRSKHRFQQFFYCWMSIRCRRNVFTEPFLSSDPLLSLIRNLLPSSECCFVVWFEIATRQRLYMLQCTYMCTRITYKTVNSWCPLGTGLLTTDYVECRHVKL